MKDFLDDSWAGHFSDMRIINQNDGTITPLAVMDGSLTDQTELIGVLHNLYEMHLPNVLVKFIDD